MSTGFDIDLLRRDVIAASYLRGSFQLPSLGATSYYFDKYLFLTRPSILRRVAAVLADEVPAQCDRLACTELGAVPLASAISLETGLPMVILRREPRDRRDVEGELSSGDRVVLIEDVVATGTHAASAVERLRTAGGVVADVLAVIDREEGASARLEGIDCRLRAIFSFVESESRA